MLQSEFLKSFGPLADEAGKRLGIDPTICLAQWALESGWGNTFSVDQKNLAGIMQPMPDGNAVLHRFATWNDFVNSYVASMHNDCPVIRNGKQNPSMSVQEIMAGNDYNTVNPSYAQDIANVQVDIERMMHTTVQTPEPDVTIAPETTPQPSAPTASELATAIKDLLAKYGF